MLGKGTDEARAVVWADTVVRQRVAGRTVRSLAAVGWAPETTGDPDRLRGPVLFALAGAWLREHRPMVIPPSANLLALGSDGGPDWERALRRNGGDFQGWRRAVPFSPVFFISDGTALAAELRAGRSPGEAVSRLVRSGRWRVTRLPALDAWFSAAPRVLQVVTTIQTGGAEKISLDLAAELNRMGIATAVAAPGRPTRTAFQEPPFFTGPEHFRADTPDGRAAEVHDLALRWGADLAHLHLLRAQEIRAIRATGLPVVVTAHNVREGWPADLASCGADLILACARAVERDLNIAEAPCPVRTVWNGIVPSAHAATPERKAAGAALRTELGIPPEARVLACVANPRPQKRLERLPAVMALLPDTHLVLAGEASAGLEAETEALRERFAKSDCEARVHWLGATLRVPALLAAADALISVSAWEGLSLAHLEALAAGLPVIATAAGGTVEIATRHPGMRLLPVDAGAATLAEAARASFSTPPRAAAPFPAAFTLHTMARRTASLYRRVLAPKPSPRPVLWLLTNNFSTGGAQTSARRLLLDLQKRGVDTRAAVVQENPRRPTPGHTALREAGIPVFAAPPPEQADAADSCAALLEAMDAAPPGTVVFWNLLTAHKLFLADALLHCRIIDVSPGAMFHSSLERYFAGPRRSDLPYASAAEYGARLAAVVVKYEGEFKEATERLGAPVAVIPNGVPEIPPSTRARKARAPLVLATSARLSPDKRLDQLIAALRLLPPDMPRWKLRVAGGPERDFPEHAKALRKLARGLPLEWCGVVPRMDRFLTEADIFVMISEPPGCPNASLEALAAGLPVIATDVGGAGEQIIDGVTGLLTPPDDPQSLAAAVARLAADPGLRETLGAAGRRHALSRFSMKGMAAAYHSLLFPKTESVAE